MKIRELISKVWKDGMSTREISRAYYIPVRTISGLLKHERDTGGMEPSTSACGRRPALDKDGLERMRKIIENQVDITLEEIKQAMNLTISVSAICRIVKGKLGFRYKKTSRQ